LTADPLHQPDHPLDDLRLVRLALEAIALLDGEESGRAREMLERVRDTAHRADLQRAAVAWLATTEPGGE